MTSAEPDPLAEAARVYDEGRKAQAEARSALKAATEQVKAARGPLAAEIVKAARVGVRQKDILARIRGVYTRENVRKICRDANVEPTE